MVNFCPLAAEIVSLVWGTTGNLNGFREHARIRKTVSGGSMIKQAWSANAWHFIVHYETYILVWKQLRSDEFTAAAKCRQLGCCYRKSWLSHRWLSKRVRHMNGHSIAICRATADRPEGRGRGQRRTSLLAVLLLLMMHYLVMRVGLQTSRRPHATTSLDDHAESAENCVNNKQHYDDSLSSRTNNDHFNSFHR